MIFALEEAFPVARHIEGDRTGLGEHRLGQPGRQAALTGQDHAYRCGDEEHDHHRHSGIGLHTPADVIYGPATDDATDRAGTLAAARSACPERFTTSGNPLKILHVPHAAWTNPPPTAEPAA